MISIKIHSRNHFLGTSRSLSNKVKMHAEITEETIGIGNSLNHYSTIQYGDRTRLNSLWFYDCFWGLFRTWCSILEPCIPISHFHNDLYSMIYFQFRNGSLHLIRGFLNQSAIVLKDMYPTGWSHIYKLQQSYFSHRKLKYINLVSFLS